MRALFALFTLYSTDVKEFQVMAEANKCLDISSHRQDLKEGLLVLFHPFANTLRFP